MDVFKILTIIGAVIGSLFVVMAFGMQGAPQQAATVAFALFFVIMPYCVHGVLYRSKRKD